MAMIKCPECGKEISDQAVSCPNCGYVLKKEPDVKRTKLSAAKKNVGAGTAYIVVGVAIFVVFCFLGIFGIIIGLFLAVLFFAGATPKLKGRQEGTCPYCGKPVKIVVGNQNCKCPSCRKVSVVKGDYLEAVEK